MVSIPIAGILLSKPLIDNGLENRVIYNLNYILTKAVYFLPEVGDFPTHECKSIKLNFFHSNRTLYTNEINITNRIFLLSYIIF